MWEVFLVLFSKLFTEITVTSLRFKHPNAGRFGIAFASVVLTILVYSLSVFAFSLTFYAILNYKAFPTLMLGDFAQGSNFLVTLPTLAIAGLANFFIKPKAATYPQRLNYGTFLAIVVYLALYSLVVGAYPPFGIVPLGIALLTGSFTYFLLHLFAPKWYKKAIVFLSLIKLPIWYQATLFTMFAGLILGRFFLVEPAYIRLEVLAALISFGLLKVILLTVTVVMFRSFSHSGLSDTKLLSLILICQWWVVSLCIALTVFVSHSLYGKILILSPTY